MRRQNKASEFSLPQETILRMIAAASHVHRNGLRDRLIVSLLYWCGLRREEVATLDVRDIDLAAQTLTVTGKGKVRTIPVSEEILSDLEILLEGRPRPAPDKIEGGKRTRSPCSCRFAHRATSRSRSTSRSRP
jgi:integrase